MREKRRKIKEEGNENVINMGMREEGKEEEESGWVKENEGRNYDNIE